MDSYASSRYDGMVRCGTLNRHPNAEELFDILTTAIKRCSLIGSSSYDASKAKTNGIIAPHMYAITDALVVKGIQIVKCHNPQNDSDQGIQRYLKNGSYLISNFSSFVVLNLF